MNIVEYITMNAADGSMEEKMNGMMDKDGKHRMVFGEVSERMRMKNISYAR